LGKFTKTEKQYLRGIINNLVLEKHNYKQIQAFLKEKGIEIDISTISRIRNNIAKGAEKWYIELRSSRYEYLAHFKERIDTVYRVQNKLWEIANNPNNQTVDIRNALAEIHHTEKTLTALYDISRYLTDRIAKDYGDSTDKRQTTGQGQQQSDRPDLSDTIPAIE
jgi:hypothetical protein